MTARIDQPQITGNIVLFGFMGTGKSCIGSMLAKKYQLDYLEMDVLIEQEQGKSISAIFADEGEPYFRNLERDLTRRLAALTGKVISTGGGVVLNEKNIAEFEKNGVGICLWAHPEVILERTQKESHRPLLQVSDPLKKITELLSYREPFYKKVHYHVDTTALTPRQIVDKITKIIEKENHS